MPSRRASRIATLAVVATAALKLWACADATQITVSVTTDLPCESIKGMTFTAGPPGQVETNEVATSTTECVAGQPRTLVLVPTGDKDSEVSVRVVVGVERAATECAPPFYKGCIVARRTLRYLPQTSLSLPILAERSCLDVPCDQASSCRAATCVSSNASCADGSCTLPPEAPLVSVANPPAIDASALDASTLDAPPTEAGATDGAIVDDRGAPDSGAADAAEGGDPDDGGLPSMTVELFAERPVSLGDPNQAGATLPFFRTWHPLQTRSVSIVDEFPVKRVNIALETANRARLSLFNCGGDCGRTTLSFVTEQGTYAASVISGGGTRTTTFALTPQAGDDTSIITNDVVCLVITSPAFKSERYLRVTFLAADLDADGNVSPTDGFLLAGSGFPRSLADETDKHADLDSNGVIDQADSDRLTARYGATRTNTERCPK